MAQYDNRIRTKFFGPAGGECYNASMPYRSGGGVQTTERDWDYACGAKLKRLPENQFSRIHAAGM